MVGLLRGRFTFFNSLRASKISRRLSVVLLDLVNFPEQFELCFDFKYSRSYKFYNLGDKTFETDFNKLELRKVLKTSSN